VIAAEIQNNLFVNAKHVSNVLNMVFFVVLLFQFKWLYSEH